MSIEVGSKLTGKVTGITHFGAFVELPSGETGLVHISEIANSYVKDVNEFLKVDDMVTVKVINVEKDGKIGLSIKKAQEQPEQPAAKPKSTEQRPRNNRQSRPPRRQSSENFDDKLSKFLKDSEERLSSLRKATESKRGGRGSRRG